MFVSKMSNTQRNTFFQWLFSSFFKIQLPQQLRDRVFLIICDGDQNQCSQIDKAIREGLFPNAVRAKCIWHVVNLGWQANNPHYSVVKHDPTVSNCTNVTHSQMLKKSATIVKD